MKCESSVAKNLAKLAACLRKCHVKQFDSIAKNESFDEEKCATGLGKPASCRTKYDKAQASLVAKVTCPACLDAGVQGDLADLVTTALDIEEGDSSCPRSNALAELDSRALVNKSAAKCEKEVTKQLGKLAACHGSCKATQVRLAFKGKTFDEDACIRLGDASCRSKYDVASGKIERKAICVECLDIAARSRAGDATHDFLEQYQGHIYCAGTVPLQ